MQYPITKIVAVAITIATFSSCSSSAHIEKANGVNFNNYKFFSWSHVSTKQSATRQSNDIVDNNIKNEVMLELKKKGFTEVVENSKADIILDYKITNPVSANRQNRSGGIRPRLGVGIGGGYGRRQSIGMGIGSYSNYKAQVTSSLVIDMFDAKTNKLLWQGWMLRDSNNNILTSKEAISEVKTILKKFNTNS